jgi:hypothetical protein
VAYYSFVLDYAIKAAGLDAVEVDLDWAVIRSREGDTEFDTAHLRRSRLHFAYKPL